MTGKRLPIGSIVKMGRYEDRNKTTYDLIYQVTGYADFSPERHKGVVVSNPNGWHSDIIITSYLFGVDKLIHMPDAHNAEMAELLLKKE